MNSMRNVLLVVISCFIFSCIIFIVVFLIYVNCNCITLLKKVINESSLRKNDNIPLTESESKDTNKTDNDKETTITLFTF
ncbi:hypothetical protein BpHYR1_011542 [Brachionus plicatilis]|uniref:Uncharacterized protein n=1 Tax=Brachionus plicatilis TaxID=10195 RepID=A0A3M7R044_BRAPC|nr:hypothetical protein BpHYR1_011542 [Brachionus plicatilis]